MPDTSDSIVTDVACALMLGGIGTAFICGVILCGGLVLTNFKRWRISRNG